MARRNNPRLRKELISFAKNAPKGIRAAAEENNILRWHFVVEGPADSPYAGGFYHGEIRFPPQYPFKPPSIWMTTPSGRFEPGVRICMSFTDYHPEEWNPAWSASTILTGLLSFMVENQRTAGSIVRPPAERRRLARQSLAWNARNTPKFRELFPDLVERARAEEERRGGGGGGGGGGSDDDGDGGSGEGVGGAQRGGVVGTAANGNNNNARGRGLGWEWQALLLGLGLMALYSIFQEWGWVPKLAVGEGDL